MQKKQEETESEERTNIKRTLSELSFEELQKLKNEMGTKLYNKTIHNHNQPEHSVYKRANKNRPREVSSKKQLSLETKQVLAVKKHTPRDPRFEPMCGTFDRKVFKDNYKFVTDLRRQEKKQLNDELEKAVDPVEKKKIKFLMQRLDNQIREEELCNKQNHEKHKKEKEFNNKLQQDEKLQFKKKSVKKLESLVSKFEDLKKTNKLQQHIERRAKKISAKERKKLDKEQNMYQK